MVLGQERVEWGAVMARAPDLLMRFVEFFVGIPGTLKNRKQLQMSQVFSVSAH